jgi:hypothetical protein
MINNLTPSKIGICVGITIVILAMSTASASAKTKLIRNTAHFGSNDHVNWGSLGPVFNPAIPGPPPFLPFTIDATSHHGLKITASLPSQPGITPPFVFRNALPPNGIPANFAPNDFVLFTGLQPGSGTPANGNPGPLTLRFERPVAGVGAQFSVDDTFTFTAYIDAYDRHDRLIGQFSRLGVGSKTPDNSAIFLGIRSNRSNIAKVVFRSSAPNRAIGIGTLRLLTTPKRDCVINRRSRHLGCEFSGASVPQLQLRG